MASVPTNRHAGCYYRCANPFTEERTVRNRQPRWNQDGLMDVARGSPATVRNDLHKRETEKWEPVAHAFPPLIPAKVKHRLQEQGPRKVE